MTRPEREPPVGTARFSLPTRRRDRPRALFISPAPPDRTGNGLAIRAGVALEALAGRFDVRLVFVPVHGEIAVPPWIAELAHETLVLPESLSDRFLRTVPRISALGEQQRALVVYPRPVPARFCTPEATAQIAAFAGQEIDLVYVFRLYLFPLAEPWLEDGVHGTRVVLDMDEDDANVARQIAQLQRRDGHQGAAEVGDADAAKFELMAKEWLPRADLVLAASAKEVESLQELVPGVTSAVLPNPVPPAGEEGTAPAVDLLFVGNLSYLPNVDAACWLCRDVLPLMRERLGRTVRVALVGSTVDERVASLAADGDVVVLSDPPSVTPWYRATTVAVAPLRCGGGTRIKILEAFAHRRPVVSTHLGAEGLPVTDGVHLLIGDSHEEFAERCTRLISDSSLRASLVHASEKVAIEHARPRVVARLTELIEMVAPGPSHGIRN